MEDLRTQFDGLGDRAWLNCAHQAPLPRAAVTAAEGAIARKRSPWLMDDEDFVRVPRRLRAALAGLIGARPDDVVLANSASYGIELLARTLPLDSGDEVLLVEGDFPATVYPWLPLRERGVRLRFLPGDETVTPGRLGAELGPRTRAFCSSWVFSFSGRAVDLAALGGVCRERGVSFIVNGSQAIGARALDVSALPIDALVCSGFKWLCGPYATGFAWMTPGLRESLTYRPAYWLTHQLAGDSTELDRSASYELAEVGTAAYDVFCTANFLNFEAWTASVELLRERGVEAIATHDQSLVERLIDGLAGTRLRLLSPPRVPQRSTLVFATAPDPADNVALHARLRDRGVDVALRQGQLRFSPHLYNDEADIDRALEALAQ